MEARSGNGGIELIEAPAGAGKSALLEAAAAAAAEMKMTRLSACATEIERELPFGAIRQLLEGHLRSLPEPVREELLAGGAAAAAAVLGLAPAPAATAPTVATAYGLYWLVAGLAEREPLLLILDDAHLVDADSARFLSFMAPRLARLPAILLLAARADEPGSHLRLAGTASGPAARPIVPQPLSVDACAAVARSVLGASLAPALGQACHQASGGNPFYLRSLLDHLGQEGVAPDDVTSEMILSLGPRAVTRTIVARLGDPDEPPHAVARAIAVLGDECSPTLVDRLAGVDAEERTEAVDELAAVAILDGNRIAYAHPIVRNAVYGDMGRGERSAMHRRAAELLRGDGATAGRIAAHLLLTDPTGDHIVVETLRDAANDAVARGAPAVAVALLRRALAEPASGEIRDAMVLELGLAELATEGVAAREHLREALESIEPGEDRVAVARSLAAAHLRVGELGPLSELLRAEIDRAAVVGPELGRALESDLVLSLLTGLDGAAMREAHERIEHIAPELVGASEAERALLSCLAYSRLCRGLPVTEVIEPAARRLERTPREGPESIPTTDWIMALGVLLRCGELDRVEEAALRGLQAAETSGSLYAVAGARWALGVGSQLRGRLRDASAQLEVALRGAREFGALAGVHASLVSLVGVEVQRGDLDAATAALAADGLEREPIEHVATPGELLECRAHLRLAQGDARAALEDFDRVAEFAVERGDLGPGMTAWRSGAALARSRLGEREEARALAATEVERARRFGAVRTLGVALVVAGRVEGGERGLDLLGEAADLLDGSPFRVEHAEALVEQGAILRRFGKRAAGREPLRAGLELARSCGATKLAERAFEELRATGARPRKILYTGVDALTPSELRVARLAASGMSNREIAQELVVSPRTIEFHLHQVFVKLEISGRGELPKVLVGVTA